MKIVFGLFFDINFLGFLRTNW